jgi:arginase
MPVAHLMGLMEHGSVEGFDWLHPSLKPENLVYIGLRDIDKNEK